MKRYGNLSGRSGVVAYALRPAGICVKFVNGAAYEYTRASAGAQAIAEMQALAQAGHGLSTFIAQHKPPYESQDG